MSKLIVGDVETNSINGGPLAGFRNAIINGGFDHWQRGTSFVGAAQYTADRWYALTFGSGATDPYVARSTRQGLPGSPGEGLYFLAWGRTAGTTIARLQQPIENVRRFAGRTVTLSFNAYAATAAHTIGLRLDQIFGTGGTPSTAVSTATETVNVGVGVGASATRHSVTFTVPSVDGKIVGTNGNDHLLLIVDSPASGAFDLRFFDFQLEEGSVATPFERRPVGTELALCQRYFQTVTQGIAGQAISAGAAALSYYPPVVFRAIPTVSLSAPAKLDWPLNANYIQSSTNIGVSFPSELALNLNMQNFSGLTVHSRLVLRDDGGFITLDAEI